MTVRIGKIKLLGVQDIHTEETRNIVGQRIPAQKGGVVQDLGRDPVIVSITGLLFGEQTLSDLEKLRQAQESAKPLPFAADIAIGTELTEVILEDFKVRQLAGYQSRYRFTIRVREHIAPPQSPEKALAPVNEAVAADADAWAADSTAAAGALQNPETLSGALQESPQLLSRMSSEDLAGALADNAEALDVDCVGGILQSVGARDPEKMGMMLDSMNKKGALGGLMDKFAQAGASLKQMLSGINLTALGQGLVNLFSAGVELLRLLKDLFKKIPDILKQLKSGSSQLDLETFLKTSVDDLKQLIQTITKFVESVDKVVKALKPQPRQGGGQAEPQPSVSTIAEKLNSNTVFVKIINAIKAGLTEMVNVLEWIGNLLMDLGGISGLLGISAPILQGGEQFVNQASIQIDAVLSGGFDGPSPGEKCKHLSEKTSNVFGQILSQGKVTLDKIWQFGDTVLGLDCPILKLKDKLLNLNMDIDGCLDPSHGRP